MKCSFQPFAGKTKGQSRFKKNHSKIMRFHYPHNEVTYQADITVQRQGHSYVNVDFRYHQCTSLPRLANLSVNVLIMNTEIRATTLPRRAISMRRRRKEFPSQHSRCHRGAARCSVWISDMANDKFHVRAWTWWKSWKKIVQMIAKFCYDDVPSSAFLLAPVAIKFAVEFAVDRGRKNPNPLSPSISIANSVAKILRIQIQWNLVSRTL